MSHHGINALGIEFSWSRLELQPGKFNDAYIKDCLAFLDLARKYDIHCVVQLAMHYAPRWLSEKYPDFYLKKPDGSRGEGNFFTFCPDNPDFRRELRPAIEKFISALKSHPQILAYSPWNEPALKGDVCYCTHTLVRFNGRAPEPVAQGPEWLRWMQFRQKNFLEFFSWMKDVTSAIDPDHPLTIKGIWMPMDSTVAWASATRFDYWAKVAGIMGHDPYPHPYDFFINRWVADWLRSAAPQKPAWFLEYNRAFGRKHGLTTPAETRAWTYQAIAHGITGFFYFFYPMNPFDPDYSDNRLAFSYCDGLKPTPALSEIYKMARELQTLVPLLKDFHIPEPQIAILHSWATQFQLAGEKFPTANETVPAQILYRLGYRVTYISEDDLISGRMKNYKLLFVTGTVAISDAVLAAIERFHDSGGHIVACARFAEMDEYGNLRKTAPPDFFRVKVLERKTEPRKRIELPTFKSMAFFNNHTQKTVRTERFRYATAHPMSWESALFDLFYDSGIKFYGEKFSGGTIIGFEDMKVTGEVIECVAVKRDAKILATFAPLQPAIVATPRTIYIARDLSWSGEVMQKLIEAAAKRADVRRFAWATGENDATLPNIDIGVLENDVGRHLIIVTCSDRLYEWDGTPVRVRIHIRSSNPFTNILTGKGIRPTTERNEISIIERTFPPGDVLCLLENP